MIRRWGICALLGALAATGLAAPPAVAEVVRVAWPQASCATGAMTVQLRPDGSAHVDGWIQPCPGTAVPDGAVFAVVYYGAEGAGPGRFHPYAGPDTKTRITGEVADGKSVPPQAICMAFGPDDRLSCHGFEVDGLEVVGVTPIATDDPRVNFVVLGPSLSPYYCGTCV